MPRSSLTNTVLISILAKYIVVRTTLPCLHMRVLSSCHSQCFSSKLVIITCKCWQMMLSTPPTRNFFQLSGSFLFPDKENFKRSVPLRHQRQGSVTSDPFHRFHNLPRTLGFHHQSWKHLVTVCILSSFNFLIISLATASSVVGHFDIACSNKSTTVKFPLTYNTASGCLLTFLLPASKCI